MGVRGVKHLLRDIGWLPSSTSSLMSEAASPNHPCSTGHHTNGWNGHDKCKTTTTTAPCYDADCGCSTQLWQEYNASKSTSLSFVVGNNNKDDERRRSCSLMEKLPPKSRLLIDGNGLAFYLHSIAYARHLRFITKNNNNNCCPLIRSLSRQESIVEALPCMVPLDLIRQVTVEFITGLVECNNNTQNNNNDHYNIRHNNDDGSNDQIQSIHVYWDGPYRRCKSETDLERTLERQRHQSNLELFCRHGSIPIQFQSYKHIKKYRYVCEWKEEFPFSHLLLTVVRHTIQQQQFNNDKTCNIEMVYCTEEADIELAMKASGDGHAFVMGYDSDFFFYKDIQYIPFNRLSIVPKSGLYAFVARRSELASLLGLHNNESRLVDLAILMGNDYIDSSSKLNIPQGVQLKDVQSIVYYLQSHEEYVVTAKDDYGQRAVDFVRSLYNLNMNHLEGFAFDDNNALNDTSVHETIDHAVTKTTGSSERNKMDVAQLLPEDMSVRDGLIRYLQGQLNQKTDSDIVASNNVPFLSPEVLEAYKLSTLSNDGHHPCNGVPKLKGRPTWDEVQAAFFIERCIYQLYNNKTTSQHTLSIRATPPDTLMNRMGFHSILASMRHDVAAATTEEVSGNKQIPTNETNPKHKTPNEIKAVEQVKLPIDEHESAIIDNIKRNRVTIIFGETGCGKSSRVPVMLLKAPPPDGSLRKVKLFISQPRRIAAKALVERVRQCEPELRNKFALRMGHGWKEYESKETQVYFVTTGYLVRLLANHPERFDECTHLVIDEVHERSVDTDILCLLCRRLLRRNANIRLVLMSATLATKLYREYFNVPNEPIHVGVRRFPITEYFIEDLQHFGLPTKEASAALAIQKEIEAKQCRTAPTSAELSKRFELAACLTTIVGKPGASVLIFVPGMAEIISISECIESFHMAGIRYTCYPIHSDIPFEEQMGAFDEPAEDEMKVIIATNAAESSVTLPNVDHVICLGLCRQIIYNQASHRQVLTPTWISQASATQRAGRTGRVRPGSVYRLYTRRAYENFLEEFEPGEMVRVPLDSIILMLKQILHEEVKPVFQECLEPPPVDTIERSFQSLYRWNFITEPDDRANITSLGTFVSSLGVDLAFGSLIGLGIQFGVAAEAIEMVAMMSLPKTPFQTTSPVWHDVQTFNDTASKTYVSKCKFDAGLYSEPLALMNALWDYTGTPNKNGWCFKNRIAVKRWQQVVSSSKSLRKRVADFLGVKEQRLQVQLPPRWMPYEKLLILRLLKVWVFSESIVECSPSKLRYDAFGSVAVSVKGKPSSNRLTGDHLKNILHPKNHPYKIVERNEVNQTGMFEEEGSSFNLSSFISDSEGRLLSYSCEMNLEAAFLSGMDSFFLYIDEMSTAESGIWKFLETMKECMTEKLCFVYEYTGRTRRGFQERACGMWTAQDSSEARESFARQKKFRRFHITRKGSNDDGKLCSMVFQELISCNMRSVMIWEFSSQGNGKKKKKTAFTQLFSVTMRGECKQISSQDLHDLLGRQPVGVSTNTKKNSQSIVFERQPTDQHKGESDSTNHPLFFDVPEGARILAILASSQRKMQNLLRFPRAGIDKDGRAYLDSEETIDFALPQEEIDLSKRWKRLDSSNLVFVDETSVPASAIHTTSTLFGVAANALELQKGGLKVEGLTLLPPNPLFLLLSFLSFGLELDKPMSWIAHQQNKDSSSAIAKKISNAYTWLVNRAKEAGNGVPPDQFILRAPPSCGGQSHPLIWDKVRVKDRLIQAHAFHESSFGMEEKLVCFPEKIKELCKLFDGVDGRSLSPWTTIHEEALTEDNLSSWQLERKTSTTEEHPKEFPIVDEVQQASDGQVTVQNTPKSVKCHGATAPHKEKSIVHHAIRHFDDHIKSLSNRWFSTTLSSGESMPAFPSTNILSLLFQLFEEQVLNTVWTQDKQGNYVIALDTSNWDIACYKKGDGVSLYKACFVNDSIRHLPTVMGRGKNKLPKWIKKNKGRPSTITEANDCVPPNIKGPTPVEVTGEGLLFESIHEAVQMEAAFWLEQQFCHAMKTSTRHWFMHSIDQMIQILRKHHDGSLSLLKTLREVLCLPE